MSNIYIQEPPTHGKVLLSTSVGDIDIELWSKEAPKACRNFIQLLMEGYYDGTIFHRVVKDFIVQGGDPTGTGEGGESIYGAPFKDEIHTRLRFVRRGLVAMANAGPNDNGSQFFFTFAAAPELNKKHTIFGKVVGNTLFNMLKLEEVETDENDRPLFPPKILKGEILSNPFDDIIPRTLKKKKGDGEEQKKPKSKSKATKNFNLLSFGEEAEEDEEQTNKASKTMRGKSKSSHDLIDDPRLSSTPAVETEGKQEGKKRKSGGETEGSDTGSDSKEKMMESVRKKLKKEEVDNINDKERDDNRREDRKREDSDREHKVKEERKREEGDREERRKDNRKVEDSSREDKRRDDKRRGDSDREEKRKDDRKKEDSDREEKRKENRKREDSEKVERKREDRDGEKSNPTKSDELRKESRKLQRELAEGKKRSDKKKEDAKKEDPQDNTKDMKKESTTEKTREGLKKETELEMMPKVDMLEEYKQERQKYKELRQKQGKKGTSREAETLAMLAKFQNKLHSVQKIARDYEDEEEKEKEEDNAVDDATDMSWLNHKLHFDDKSRKVLDANVHDADRYEIFDPRNPLTKRRREASKKSSRDRR